jgi:hypothetical protein
VENAIQPDFSDVSTNVRLQLSKQMPTPELEDAWEFVSVNIDLSPDVQRRVKIIQQLMSVSGPAATPKCSSRSPRTWE